MTKLVICPHEAPDGEICGFEARGDDEDEVISVVQRHAETEHTLNLSRRDIEQMIEEV